MKPLPLTPFHAWLVETRRALHRIPELGYREFKTAAFIAERLRELGVGFQSEVGGTGIIASIKGRNPGPTLALRADMDALPLHEQNEIEYRSEHPGVMHACGHDGHVTMLLGVIRALVEKGWSGEGVGSRVFVFQPAEEGGAGARAILDSGSEVLRNVSAYFAIHVHPELPAGHIGLSSSVSNAASDGIKIRITGKGGHGAQPHLCVDPIVAAAHLITVLQTIVSRNVHPLDSAVLTIGRFRAGSASNIIPQEAVLQGTLRTLRETVRSKVLARLEEIVRGVEISHCARVKLTVTPGYPLLVNDENVVRFTMERARGLLGPERVHEEPARMGSEDFAYFLQRAPGALIRLGCHDPSVGFRHGLHSPCFDMDERALDAGVLLFLDLLDNYAAGAAG
ncbi:MAG: M20 family metallopeptidase [Syntrophobacteraceae bacterium]